MNNLNKGSLIGMFGFLEECYGKPSKLFTLSTGTNLHLNSSLIVCFGQCMVFYKHENRFPYRKGLLGLLEKWIALLLNEL